MAKTSCKKGQYYCNTDQKCKPIPDGYKVRKDGILVSDDKKMTYKKKKKMKEEFVSLPLQLEVPQNDGEFKLGLMFRESLEQDRGMLFIFESDDYWTFHMKNTYIPLDIAFLKEDGTVDSIEELEPMSPVPVGPNSKIRYAVEVNRGWFAENNVNVGDVLLEEEPKKSLSDRSFRKLEKRAKNFELKSQEDQDQYALELSRRSRDAGKGYFTVNRNTDQKNRRGRTVGHNKGIKDHYDWRSTLDEKSNIETNLHTRGGKTTPEPNSQTTDSAIKKVGQKLKDKSFDKIQEQSIMRPSERFKRSQQSQQNLSKATSGFKLSGSSTGGLRMNPVKQQQQNTKQNTQTTQKPVNNAGGGAVAGGGGSRKVDGRALMNKLKSQSGDRVQSGGGVNRSQSVVKSGNRTTTTTRTSANDSTPAGAAAVQSAKAGFADRMAARRAARDAGGGAGGGGQQGAKKPGFLSRVKNRLGAVKQGIGQAAGGVKKVAGAVGSQIKDTAVSGAKAVGRVAAGAADAATGNLTDFDKKGGKPQGLSRVVAGGIDKVTGDRTDLDKRGATPLNAGQRAAQQQKQQAQPAQQQAKPAPQQGGGQQQQPVKKMGAIEKANRARMGDERVDALKAKNAQFQAAKKSGNLAQYRKDNPKLSGAERAKAMARARIAAKKSASAGSSGF